VKRAELNEFRTEIKRLLQKESEARSERYKQFNLALLKSDDKTARRYLALLYYDILCEDFKDKVTEDDEFRVGLDEIEDDDID
jgi:hypothetical protein